MFWPQPLKRKKPERKYYEKSLNWGEILRGKKGQRLNGERELVLRLVVATSRLFARNPSHSVATAWFANKGFSWNIYDIYEWYIRAYIIYYNAAANLISGIISKSRPFLLLHQTKPNQTKPNGHLRAGVLDLWSSSSSDLQTRSQKLEAAGRFIWGRGVFSTYPAQYKDRWASSSLTSIPSSSSSSYHYHHHHHHL